MANYYTYGMVPDVDETVYGTSVSYAGLGNPEFADRGLPEEEPVGPSPLSLAEEPVPADRGLPEEPYYSEPTPAPSSPIPNLFVEGADVPQGGYLDAAAADELFANFKKAQELQKLALEPGLLEKGFTGVSGVTTPGSGQNIFATPTREPEAGIDFDVTPEMAAALQRFNRPADISAAEREAVTRNPRVQALQNISGLLQANKFGEAFNAAIEAEKELGGTFVENITDPNNLRRLRGPMTADEITKFYNEMPDEIVSGYETQGNEFIKELAIQRNIEALGGQSGYVSPSYGMRAKVDPTVGIIGDLIAAAAAATGIGIPAAMAISGAQKYVTSGGNVKAALVSAALTGAGMKVGEALKAPGLADLTEVTTTSSKAAVAAANAADAAIKAGVAPGALAEIVVTAAKQAAPGLAQGVINSVTGAVINQLASQGVEIPEQQLQQAQQATQRGPLDQAKATAAVDPGLEEVVVQSLRKGTPIDINTLLASTGAQGTQDILSDRQIAEQKELEAREAEQKPQEKEPEDFAGTFSISTDRLPALNVGQIIPNLSSQLYDSGYKPPGLDTIPAEDLAEIAIRGSKPVDLDVNLPIPNLSNQFKTPTYEKPALADTPLEEIVVEAKRPTQLELVAPPFNIPKTTTPSVSEPPTGPLEEIVVEGKRPSDLDLVAPPFTIPGKTPVENITEPKINEPTIQDKLKGLLDEYGTLENYLKLLGALGSAFSGTKGTTTAPTTGLGGMGGALPKYTYTRQQLRPDIDYYTYGTRPEAKFFDYGVQLEKPVQPEGPPAKPPGDEPVMAKGGLMGYADGGSSETRYFDGPGSGREDKIPALLSDGEYVMDAETLALLGDGSTKEGARRMDQFRANIRKHKGRALSRGQISPDAKSPDKYMGGGLA